MSLHDTLQSLVNKSYNELFVLAKMAMAKVLPYCKEMDAETDGRGLLTGILMAAVASDGTLSARESRFIGELTGMSGGEIRAFVVADPALTAETVDCFADLLDAEGKAAVCMLVAAVMACDERISTEENAYLRKILQ